MKNVFAKFLSPLLASVIVSTMTGGLIFSIAKAQSDVTPTQKDAQEAQTRSAPKKEEAAAASDPEKEQEQDEEEKLIADRPTKPDSSRMRFLSLYVGIDVQERLSQLPDNPHFAGDFRNYVNVGFNRDLRALQFTPKKEGVATLTVLNSKNEKIYEFRLDVKKSNLTKVAREIRALLSDIEGVQIKIINNKVVVDGQILLPRDMNRIHAVVKQYEGQASTLVTLSPIAQRKIALVIENQIHNPEVQVRAVNDKFILEGNVQTEDEKKRAFIIAQTYVPNIIVEQAEADGIIKKIRTEPVINLINVAPAPEKPPGKVIQLVVHFVELNKDYEKGFRFQWSPSISDGSGVSFSSDSRSPGGVVSTITGTISSLIPKLNWAKAHGHARVLESSEIMVEDGQKGDLKRVTQYPYQIVGANGTIGTQFKDVGLTVNITPKVQNGRSDNIKLTLDFNMSSLVGMAGNAPITTSNQLQTIINVRSGQSAAIGGLISNSSMTNYNKLPDQGTNPIISLYASKQFTHNQSQFVVFVTPIIKSSASAGSEKIKKKFRLRD